MTDCQELEGEIKSRRHIRIQRLLAVLFATITGKQDTSRRIA